MIQEDTPKRAAIYARSATGQEIGHSFAIEAQIQACRQYAKERGYQVVDSQIYQEIASGTAKDRPLLQSLYQEARYGAFAVLVVYDVARLARNPHLLLSLLSQFAEIGVAVESVSEPLAASTECWELITAIHTTVADIEREKIATRSQYGKRAAQARREQ